MAVVAVINILRRPILSARTAETGIKAKTRQKIIVL
jgi:hypothetical protein